MTNTKKELSDKIAYADSALEAVKGADALVIFTEWNEFKQIDLEAVKRLMKSPVIIDGRNLYPPKAMQKMGIKYYSVGR